MTKHLSGMKQVGPQHFQEDPGLSFEDFAIGDLYEHWPGRTITETDNIWFTNLTMNSHPLHFDNHFGSHTEFGKCLINSTLTVSIVVGLSVSSTSQKAVANLGWEYIKLPNPVYAGDTIYGESTVLEKRESKSRKNCGIVKVRHVGRNQNNTIICDMVRSFLVPKKGKSTAEKIQNITRVRN